MRFQSGAHARQIVTKRDLCVRNRSNPDRWVAPHLDGTDNVLRGNIGFLTLRKGLTVHYSNAEDLHDLKTESECGRRICVSVFLEGTIRASIGGMEVPMPTFLEDEGLWQPIATIFAQARTEQFVRRACKGMRLKKVIISVSPEWLDLMPVHDCEEVDSIRRFARCHLARRTWVPSAHARSLAEQIISMPQTSSLTQLLYVEARVIGILEEAFGQLSGVRNHDRSHVERQQDRPRLLAIDRYLRDHVGEAVSVEVMAREIGLSMTSLQRLLTQTHGVSASRYIRQFRLEQARDALERDSATIAEAAFIAGYGSPANFSTAFKKCFGLSPSKLRER